MSAPEMTRPECAARLQRWLDGDQTYVPEDAIAAAAGYLRETGAAEMREAAAPDKFAAFGRMVWDAITERMSTAMMDETDADNAELAVKAGLAEHVRYDPEKHGHVQDAEPGDKIVWWGAPLPAREAPEADEALIDAWAHSSDPGHDPDAAGTALALRLREVSGRFTAFATDVRRIAAERVEFYIKEEMPAAAHGWQEIVTYCEGALKP